MGYIYKITNTQNQNCYIGKTTRSIQQRWKEHQRNIYKYPDLPLYRALVKYGTDNFTIEEVEQCDDSDLDKRENYWIKYYNSYENGYNCTLGGEGGYGNYSDCIEDIATRYKSGERLDLLCKEYHHDYISIRRELLKMGIEINTQAGPDKLSKAVVAINPDTLLIVKQYKSISEAGRDLCKEGNNPRAIANHISKYKNTNVVSHGFLWKTI